MMKKNLGEIKRGNKSMNNFLFVARSSIAKSSRHSESSRRITLTKKQSPNKKLKSINYSPGIQTPAEQKER